VLLVDDLLAAPLNGILWVFREIHKAATDEQHNRRDQIMAALSALYISLEQGEITDEVFDAQEAELLDELDALDGVDADAEEADDDDGDADSGERITVLDREPPEYALKSMAAGDRPSGGAPGPQTQPVSKKEILS